MFEDFSTTDICPEPRVFNSVCDLPSMYSCLFWEPAIPGELFTAMEWTSVLLNRIDAGLPVDPSSTAGYCITGRG